MPSLRRLRLGKGWSLRDLAAEAGVSVGTLLAIEKRRRVARPSTMRRVAAALGVPILQVEEFDTSDDHGDPPAGTPD